MRRQSCVRSRDRVGLSSAHHPEPATAGEGSLLFSRRASLATASLPRPLNSKLPQFLLQTLPVQSHLRRRLRHVPMMLFEFPPQIYNLKLPLSLAKIRFAQKRFVPRLFHSAARASAPRAAILANLLRQIGGSNFIAVAQHQRALQRVTQFPHVSRPMVASQ